MIWSYIPEADRAYVASKTTYFSTGTTMGHSVIENTPPLSTDAQSKPEHVTEVQATDEEAHAIEADKPRLPDPPQAALTPAVPAADTNIGKVMELPPTGPFIAARYSVQAAKDRCITPADNGCSVRARPVINHAVTKRSPSTRPTAGLPSLDSSLQPRKRTSSTCVARHDESRRNTSNSCDPGKL